MNQRYLSKLCKRLVFMTLAVAFCGSVVSGDVNSTFDSDSEGWILINEGHSWQGSGGNPGGYIRYDDNLDNDVGSAILAPDKFLGNWTDMGVTELAYESRIFDTGYVYLIGAHGVTIKGPGGYAYRSGPVPDPSAGWRSLHVSITESEWTVTSGSWDAILNNVTELAIAMEYYNNWGPFEITGIDNVTLFTGVVPNSPPVADAGDDQTVEQESYEGTEVTLDGSGSTDPDSSPGSNDDIVSFDWYEGDTLIGSGETITHTFGLGSHTVTLVVTDSAGETSEDEVVIVVQDTTAPVISCPSDITIETWGQDGVPVEDERIQAFLNGASATDNCDPEPSIVNNAPAVFQAGDTIVTFTATDASGNISTCQSVVTVVEAVEVCLQIFPPIIPREGILPEILAEICFPEGINKDVIDMDEPLMLFHDDGPYYIEATCQRIFVLGRGRMIIFGYFSKYDVMADIHEDGLMDFMVVGRFASGRYFYGIDTVRIISLHCIHR
jgi:hypothetical protein